MTDPEPVGGYRHCACRDCFAVTMTTSVPEHDFCHDCAGKCDRVSECQSETAHTYCASDDASQEEIWQAAADGATVHRGDNAEALARADVEALGAKGLRQYCGACGQEF